MPRLRFQICALLLSFYLICSFSMPTQLSPDDDVVTAVLNTPGNYVDEEQEATCRRMVEELSLEEQEIAARTSYCYWLRSVATAECPAEETRIRSAMKEAKRHLVGEKGDWDSAMDSLRDLCKFRKERKIDMLRFCFWDGAVTFPEYDEDLVSKWESWLEKEIERQMTYVRGHDRELRAISYRHARTSLDVEEESFVLMNIYISERAGACTEVLSQGQQHHMIGVLDYGSFESSKAPPLGLVKETIRTLQRHYPDRGYRSLILDPPFWIKALYLVLSPFLAKETREKVRMVSGPAQKANIIGPLVTIEQAAPSLLPDGKLTAPVTGQRFLREVPFHALYDQL